jgi:hypothetical protein
MHMLIYNQHLLFNMHGMNIEVRIHNFGPHIWTYGGTVIPGILVRGFSSVVFESRQF